VVSVVADVVAALASISGVYLSHLAETALTIAATVLSSSCSSVSLPSPRLRQ